MVDKTNSEMFNINSLLVNVLDEMLEGLQVISKDWVYLYVNETVAKQGKRKKEELIGKTMMECYPGIERSMLFEQMKTCMDKKVSIRMENEFEYPDGSKGWFQLFIHPWEGGVLIFSINITDRRATEEQLLNKVTELNSVADVAVDRETKMTELKLTIKKLQEELVSKSQPAMLKSH